MIDNNTLKILHIVSGDLWAGAEIQLFTLSTTLHKTHGISVIVVLLNHGDLEKKLQRAGIKVIVLDEAKLNSMRILRLLVRILRELGPDIVHTHRFKENILGSLAALFSGRIPSIRTIHGGLEYDPALQRPYQRFIRFLDVICGCLIQRRIISVSEELSNTLEKVYPSEKISVIENGFDIETIQKHHVCMTDITKADDKIFRIGIAGRLIPVKRVDLFIQTAQYIREHYPDLKSSFHIFGDGPLLDDLKNISRELDTDKVIHFEGHRNDILAKLQEIDILIMTSDHEGLPMVLLEAMALRVPIIAHAVGGITKLLGHGSCGVLVHDHSASGYGSEVYRLVNSPHTMAEITQKAFEQVTANYSAEMNARAYVSVYSLISKKPWIQAQ